MYIMHHINYKYSYKHTQSLDVVTAPVLINFYIEQHR